MYWIAGVLVFLAFTVIVFAGKKRDEREREELSRKGVARILGVDSLAGDAKRLKVALRREDEPFG